MEGRLCHSAKLWNLVQDVLKSLANRKKMHAGRITQKQTETPLIFTRVLRSIKPRLAEDQGAIYSPMLKTIQKINLY